MATVLVLDALQRKSLVVTRFLGMDGHRVLTADTGYWTISRFSRYAAGSFTYPHPAHNPAGFLDWLRQIIARERVDAVIQTDDATTAVLAAHVAELRSLTHLLVPPVPSFAAMLDKGEAARWFERTGVPHPKTRQIGDLAEVGPAIAALGVPLVIKARVSSGARGIRFAHTAADAERAYREVHRDYPWPVLQQFIAPGPKYHIYQVYDQEGRLVQGYVQRELRQYPIAGGSATLVESVDRPDLQAPLAPLFAALPWAGPAQIDVMEDGATGQPYILEVNPRWGQSLYAAHLAGINFARLHLALAMGEKVEPCGPVRLGVRVRSLLPFDILAYLADPNRAQMDPPFFAGYGSNTWDDLLSWSDPGPTFGFLGAVAAHLFDRETWRAVLRRTPH